MNSTDISATREELKLMDVQVAVPESVGVEGAMSINRRCRRRYGGGVPAIRSPGSSIVLGAPGEINGGPQPCRLDISCGLAICFGGRWRSAVARLFVIC
jgi:hypothetical protein